jgi:uncharacterized protein
MAQLGKRNSLRVVREAPPGVYLDGEQLGEILLPNRYVPRGTIAGEVVTVFVYADSGDRLVATTETAYAEAGEFAYLRVVGTKPGVGAFLDWGMSKDLLLPLREQDRRVGVGDWVVARIAVDEKTLRLVASTRLNRFLDLTPAPYRKGEAVSLLIAGETDLGYKAIVNHAHWGLLYRSDLAGPLALGQKHEGFVREVREDGKIDLSLDAAGYSRVAPLADRIMEELIKAGGRMPFGDHSSPEEIREAFGSSKKAFKQAIGALFKERRILIEKHGIRAMDAWIRPKTDPSG